MTAPQGRVAAYRELVSSNPGSAVFLVASGAAGLVACLGAGLGELLDNFKQNGHGDVAESWIGTGPNKQVDSTQLEPAIRPDVLATLSAQTGLSREELLSRLSTTLPDAVDRYTPDGRLPPTTDL